MLRFLDLSFGLSNSYFPGTYLIFWIATLTIAYLVITSFTITSPMTNGTLASASSLFFRFLQF